MSQIVCKNLAVGYNGIPAAENINFTIEKGGYLCVTGENGSGKSTLIKTLLNLIKPISGTIEFSDGLTQKSVGYLPQYSDVQSDFPASVTEIVLSGFLGKKNVNAFYSSEEKKEVKRILDMLGILTLEKKVFSKLSGGQKQRVLLARALCACGGLLVLDEPVAGLDPEATEEMYATVERLNREHNISVIMITHDMNAVKKYAKQVLKIGE
ncbi:MAG: ABC transporter ATP-binding protein [Treponema sp.]|uniref:metal ABC transporter ATP-binding protein n=1 Tax=Treponema sp. TaxID=166 RepID=UPI00298DB866|nr:ABC transporter ATP-binding protein [Treponema sp.]MDD5812103.1 ABC transporter ATP-binding protein [Treponema sp.]